MKLKLDEAGHVVVADGKPVYVHDDGKETPFDYAATLATIGRLNGEAKSHRERAEAAEGRLKTFDGLDDPEAARKALATVKNLDDKKLVDAGEVESIRAAAIKAVEEKFAPVVKERDRLQASLTTEIVGGSFARSKFIGEKLAIPPDLAEAAFGKHFTVEGGKLAAKDHAGNPIYSRARPGELATFDEAIETLVDAYPHRDTILKGTGASGGGAPNNNGGGGGARTMKRAAFDVLDPQARHTAIMKDKITVVD